LESTSWSYCNSFYIFIFFFPRVAGDGRVRKEIFFEG
jgi:hypothetical protein